MSQRDLLHTGDLYFPNDPSIMADQIKWLDRLYDFNNTRPTELGKREKLLKKMFAEIGEGCYIEPPLHTNMGGHHVHFGKYIYANFGLTLVDDTHIYVGDYTMFGPHVTVATAGHPIEPGLREKGIKGKETTPFLLARVSELTGGDSLSSNIKLVFNNAKVAALTAVEYCKL